MGIFSFLLGLLDSEEESNAILQNFGNHSSYNTVSLEPYAALLSEPHITLPLNKILRKFKSVHSSMALQPLLGPGLPQKTSPLFSVLCVISSHPLIPGICEVSLRTTFSHLVLGFPLVLYYEISHSKP